LRAWHARASQSSFDTALHRYRSGIGELLGAVEIRPKRLNPQRLRVPRVGSGNKRESVSRTTHVRRTSRCAQYRNVTERNTRRDARIGVAQIVRSERVRAFDRRDLGCWVVTEREPAATARMSWIASESDRLGTAQVDPNSIVELEHRAGDAARSWVFALARNTSLARHGASPYCRSS
jgi:hypothetical protein